MVGFDSLPAHAPAHRLPYSSIRETLRRRREAPRHRDVRGAFDVIDLHSDRVIAEEVGFRLADQYAQQSERATVVEHRGRR